MKKRIKQLSTVSLLLVGIGSFPLFSYGNEVEGQASLTLFGGDPNPGVLDPENPDDPADPGEVPHTKGPLRIDYAPNLVFGDTKIVKDTMTSKADAMLFHNKKGPRANFVQISDYRGTGTGWTLFVRQEGQFSDTAQKNLSLKGASLSFDKAWANSTLDQSLAPTPTKDTIAMNNIGESYILANADTGKGMGTWSLSFGASETNPLKLESTLSPKVDAHNQAIVDSTFENQPMYQNNAIRLTIPASNTLTAGNYSTVLTWTIAELP